jgi:hypothetical protein
MSGNESRSELRDWNDSSPKFHMENGTASLMGRGKEHPQRVPISIEHRQIPTFLHLDSSLLRLLALTLWAFEIQVYCFQTSNVLFYNRTD